MVVQTKNSPTNENAEIDENSDGSNSKSESAANVLNLMKKRHKSSLKNGFDSLEILRVNIQGHFNKQVDILMKDFMDKFFQPAIENIRENTDEKIDEKQIKKICRNMLEDCARTQYSNDIFSIPLKTTIKMDSDSSEPETSESATSLLHQALKRKRTESETENLYKRQFFITTSTNNLNTTITTHAIQQRPSSSLLTSALTSPPKAMRHTGSVTRPIFHLIPANRNLKSTHVELLNLLKQNSSLHTIKTEICKASAVSSSTSSTTDTSSQN